MIEESNNLDKTTAKEKVVVVNENDKEEIKALMEKFPDAQILNP